MPSAPKTDTLMTADELLELPDDGYRCELVHGFLIRDQAPGCEHAAITINIGHHLKVWARGAGYVTGEGGYKLRSDPDTVRVPDVAFVSHERVAGGRPTGFVDGAPDLAVEILSPTDRMTDVLEKVSDYFDAGSAQVWIVVPSTRTVMVYRSFRDLTVLTDTDTLVGDDPVAGLELPVADIFE